MGAPFFAWLCSTACIGTGWIMSWRLAREENQPETIRWLTRWSIKGLAVPLLIWILMNVGLSWRLQPFMPQIQAAQNSGGSWLPVFLEVVAAGFFVISSYWAALTLAWALAQARAGLEEESRSQFKGLCWTAFLGMLIPAAVIFLLGGVGMLGLAASAILIPIAGYAPGILSPNKMPPIYARAIAKMKFGKYSEAEWEIINQLEKSQDDFEGWMMLAELYANNFHDLAEAQHTILEICNHPRTTPPQLSIALHRLADWQLKLADDPNGARAALQMICDRLPGSHLARMAHLRMNQLPRTSQELQEQRIAKAIPLPALSDHLYEESSPSEPVMARSEAIQHAERYVEKLKQDPNDTEAREKLARTFAEHLNKPDLGLEQLTLLLNMPDQDDAKRVEWLGLSAAWQIKFRRDIEAGRRILERLIREFPNTPQAFAARRRLRLLDMEAKMNEAKSQKSPIKILSDDDEIQNNPE
jgi:hypothetical protein